MILDKGRPGLPAFDGWQTAARTSHVLLDRSFVDCDPQLEQFALNPLGAPRTVADCYLFNQRDGVRCN